MALSDQELSQLHDLEELDQLNKRYGKQSIGQAVDSKIVQPVVNTAKNIGEAVPKAASSLGQDVSDFGQGAVQGATMGGADELAGGTQAMLQAGQGSLHNMFPSMFQQSPRQTDAALASQGFQGNLSPTLTDVYRKAQQEATQDYEKTKERSPYLTGAGELAGGIAGFAALPEMELLTEGKVLGKGAMNAGKEIGKRMVNAAPIGAAIGALSSDQGKLIGATPEEQAQLLQDTGKGAITGSALAGAISLGANVAAPYAQKAGKAIMSGVDDYVQDSPLARQAMTSFNAGRQKIGFTGDENTMRVLNQNKALAEEGTEKLYGVKRGLGEQIDNTLKQATDEGITVEHNPETLNNLTDLLESGKGQIGRNFIGQNQELLQKFYQGSLTPTEANELRIAFKNLANDKYEANPDLSDKASAFAKSLYDDIENSMGDSLKEANGRFKQFMEAGPETLVNQGTSPQNAQRYLSDTSRGRNKVYNELGNVIEGAGKPGTSTDTAKLTLDNFAKNLDKYEEANPGLMEKLGFNKDEFLQKLKGQADVSNISSSIRGIHQDLGAHNSMMNNLVGRGVLTTANIAGKTAANAGQFGKAIASPATSVIKLGKNLYHATDEELTNVAQMMGASNPRNQTLGQALADSIQNNDNAKKNAAIFAIMQNPSAREYLYSSGAVNTTPEQ